MLHFLIQLKGKFVRPTLLTILMCSCFSIAVSAQKGNQRVVVIGLDGFSTDGFKTARHPNLDTMIAAGVLSLTTRAVMPSVTLPNWTSHLTGSGPEEHGVTANSWTVAKHPLEAIDTDQNGFYPSIFKVLKEQVPNVKTGYYYNWAELVNSMNTKYMDELSFEWNDKYDSNYQKAFNFIQKNRKDPTLVFLYSVHTDHAGHGHNWMSPQYINAIEAADTAIGIFLNKLKSENLYDNTHFILITDHGGSPKTGHGGTSMEEMLVPWAITGPLIKKNGITDMYNSNKNTALVIAKILGVKPEQLPKSWTGILPTQIFK
ncbi:MAG: alkaline phosphatase family protein [Bacteroidota bacterium]